MLSRYFVSCLLVNVKLMRCISCVYRSGTINVAQDKVGIDVAHHNHHDQGFTGMED